MVTGDISVTEIRWMCFTFAEMGMFNFVITPYKSRHFELIATSVFTLLLLTSSLWYSMVANLVIAGFLIVLATLSKYDILRRWFTWSFALYGLTSVVPIYFGFTQTESILMGVIFTLHFAIGVKKLYVKDKVDDELKKLLLENKL
jgi:hypothetical protein